MISSFYSLFELHFVGYFQTYNASFRLEEAGSNTSTQIELNKKREVGKDLFTSMIFIPFFFKAELLKLKGDLDEAK